MTQRKIGADARLDLQIDAANPVMPFRSLAAFVLTLSVAAPLAAAEGGSAPPKVVDLRYEVVNTFPHDRAAFTQGLVFRDGFLYEGTGLNGRSSVRKVVLETGAVIRQRSLENQYFGEGLADWNDTLVQLTWQSGTGFVYDLDTLEPRRSFGYEGEGWGLTQDGQRLIMSDGTPSLRFLDPETLRETGRLEVRYEGQPLRGLNELEMVEGQLFANVWPTQWVVRIDPQTGDVNARLDLGGLLPTGERGRVDVLNGIAWDARGKRLFVTGKLWPTVFEIRVIEAAAAPPATAGAAN